MFLLIDKPKGVTSHDVIDMVRKITGEKKVGHGGTLDPNATGLLIVGVGRENTKKLGELTKNTDKTYVAEIILGEERDTGDAEGKVIRKEKVTHIPTVEEINSTLTSFIGKNDQVPPVFSAIKIKGKKAYQFARKGDDLKLEPRRVTIFSLKLTNYDFPIIGVECSVSSGTYIRSLARDIGQKLNTYAYLNNLRRTMVGKYKIADAVSIDKLTSENWRDFVIQ